MGLFNRKPQREGSSDDSNNGENKNQKGGWRRPANTAFKQQRLKAWQPILTPKTVLPTFFIIGLLFGGIGAALIWGSSLVSEITIDYTGCDSIPPSQGDLSFMELSSSHYSYHLSSDIKDVNIVPPAYAFSDQTSNSSAPDDAKKICLLEFDIPADFKPSVFMYYKLTNFYQNHRRYVKSLNSDQLKGKGGDAKTLNDSDCKPLGTINGKPIYPCGLIANSMFNDTFLKPQWRNPADSNVDLVTYNFTEKGIAWPGESKKYVSSPVGNGNGYNSFDDIVPPPNWALKFKNYTADNIPDLKTNEHFQNWMRTAGLPTFTKLYFRNDNETMQKGRYRMEIHMNYPVTNYKGTKSIVISTVSWIGGKNPFLGWAYVAAAGLFVLLAVAGLARHLIKPRRLGDMSLLSWNR